jgi:DNA-binding transcriptional regulator YhcF (GntR family)
MIKQQTPIFHQLANKLCDEILAGKYQADNRIPSSRELAVHFEVNPNTVVKSFEVLSNYEIIYEKRGMGYFVSPLAVEKILEQRRKQFSEEYLPQFFKTMEQLSINIEQLSKLYEQYKQNKK